MITASHSEAPDTYRRFLTRTPGPIALYLIEDRLAADAQVTWIIKTDGSLIEALGPQPLIEVRGGLFEVNGVLVVAFIVAVGPAREETLFETWINGRNLSGEGLEAIELLQHQTGLTVHLFNESTIEQRALRIQNASQPFFTHCHRRLTASAGWTMSMFDAAKDAVCRRHPSKMALWQALHS